MKIDKPAIIDFTSANHDHSSVMQGGLIAGATSLTAIFITNVVPTSTGIVGARTFEANTVPVNTVLTSCTADTANVRVQVGAEGGLVYSPTVTINGFPAILTQSSTIRWFTGYVDLTLSAGTNTVIASSLGGASANAIVNVSIGGPAITSITFGSYPGAQTELKSGDTITAFILAGAGATSISVAASGASSGIVTSATTAGWANVTITIGSASGSQPITVTAFNSLGTAGTPLASSTLTLNQTAPSFSAFTVAYPSGKLALDLSDIASVNCTVSSFDTITYSSTHLSIGSPTAYAFSKLATDTFSGYENSGTNYTISAIRAANNKSATASTLVKIASVAATASITIVGSPARLISSPAGTDYEIRITPTQVLASAPTLAASLGTWQGAGWTLSGSYWWRNLRIDDTTPTGAGTFSALTLTGLSNIAGSTITSGASYTVGGFSLRTVTFPAFSRVAPIGTAVIDQTKTVAQIVGGSVLTRHTDNGIYSNGYYIANSDGTYNATGTYLGLSDSVFAGSNTSGTLQATIQETA